MDKNPWNPAGPAFNYNIEVVTGMDREGVEAEAKSQATVLGEAVFVLEIPQAGQPGWLAGAVLHQNVRGANPDVKTVELD